MEVAANLGDVLLMLRTQSGESQDHVAEETGMSRVAYTRYESKQREPKVSVALALARHFGVTVEYLLGVEQMQPPAKHKVSESDEVLMRIWGGLNEEGKKYVLHNAKWASEQPEFAKEGSSAAMA